MSIMDALRKAFGPKPVVKMTHEVLISEDYRPYESLYQYPSWDEAWSEANRFSRISTETGNNNEYTVREIQG